MDDVIEFKNDIERLEYLVGFKIDDIKNALKKIVFTKEDSEIIELRYGLKDGKTYTLFEVADLLASRKPTEEELRQFEEDKAYAAKYGIELFMNEWNPETVRQAEARTIRQLKYILTKQKR